MNNVDADGSGHLSRDDLFEHIKESRETIKSDNHQLIFVDVVVIVFDQIQMCRTCVEIVGELGCSAMSRFNVSCVQEGQQPIDRHSYLPRLTVFFTEICVNMYLILQAVSRS